jgi:hypothetical protein
MTAKHARATASPAPCFSSSARDSAPRPLQPRLPGSREPRTASQRGVVFYSRHNSLAQPNALTEATDRQGRRMQQSPASAQALETPTQRWPQWAANCVDAMSECCGASRPFAPVAPCSIAESSPGEARPGLRRSESTGAAGEPTAATIESRPCATHSSGCATETTPGATRSSGCATETSPDDDESGPCNTDSGLYVGEPSH